MKIAVLGGTSQISKDLILSFSKHTHYEYSLFARNTKLLEEWINSENLNGRCQVYEYSKFNINRTYDIIINSVGIGDPEKAQKMGKDIFKITEQYDGMALEYIKCNEETKYIFLSSGAIYGGSFKNPVNKAVKSPEEKKKVSSNKNLLDNISSKVEDSENYFSVQVGANNKISSTNIQGLNLDKEKLFFVNIEKGKYAMNYGKHEDYGSAHKIALEIHKKGLQTAFVTKYENGVRVKISKKDYETDKTPKEIISDDINQLGYIPIGPNDKGKFIQIGTIYNWDAHNFKPLYDQLERTIYYKIKENNSVIFLVGPLQENEVFIELRNVKQLISDAFIKTIY